MYENRFYSLDVTDKITYRLRSCNEAIKLELPHFHINGGDTGTPGQLEETARRELGEGFAALTWTGRYACGAQLSLEAKLCEDTPFVRFRYILSGPGGLRLTKPDGKESLTYFTYQSPAGAERTEVRLSDHDFRLHSYCLTELPAFQLEPDAMGPILAEQRDGYSMLTAYEHGSQYPDKFLAFIQNDGNISLRAVKGNTWQGQSITQTPYETIWLQIGAADADIDDLARANRE